MGVQEQWKMVQLMFLYGSVGFIAVPYGSLVSLGFVFMKLIQGFLEEWN